MDLNHIELPASVVASLYHNTLTDTAPVSKKTTTAEETKIIAVPGAEAEAVTSPWRSLGNNDKNILIVVNSEAVYLPDRELTFLTGILTACKLSLADVVLFNFNNHPETSWKELTVFFKSKIVLLFDLEPPAFGLPMNFPNYQIQPFSGCSYLFSPSLKELENDRAEKTKLWNCLKRLFNI